jgi:hypothetical protein
LRLIRVAAGARPGKKPSPSKKVRHEVGAGTCGPGACPLPVQRRFRTVPQGPGKPLRPVKSATPRFRTLPPWRNAWRRSLKAPERLRLCGLAARRFGTPDACVVRDEHQVGLNPPSPLPIPPTKSPKPFNEGRRHKSPASTFSECRSQPGQVRNRHGRRRARWRPGLPVRPAAAREDVRAGSRLGRPAVADLPANALGGRAARVRQRGRGGRRGRDPVPVPATPRAASVPSRFPGILPTSCTSGCGSGGVRPRCTWTRARGKPAWNSGPPLTPTGSGRRLWTRRSTSA